MLDNYSNAVAAKDSFENKYQSDTGLSAKDNANAQLTSKQARLDQLEDTKKKIMVRWVMMIRKNMIH